MTTKNPTKHSSKAPRSRPPRRGNPRGGRTPFLLVVAVLAILGAGLTALILAGLGDEEDPSEPTAETTVAPASVIGDVPALPSFRDGTGAGEPAPTIRGEDIDGREVTVPRSGRPTVLLFLAHWCPHCQAEVPRVQAWLDAGGLPAEVDLVAVSTSIDTARPNYPPSAWLEREGWSPTTLTDSHLEVAEAYGLTNFPFWVAIDADGAVVTRQAGELTTSQLNALVTVAREGSEVSPE